MKKKNRRSLYSSIFLLLAFLLWTIAVRLIDVRAIGPNGSRVGFAATNAFVHKVTGVHMLLYHITDWLGLVPIVMALGFALLGMVQWIKRKKLSRVDYSLFVLGGFYVAVMMVYVLFETVTVNYRPVLINGILETSYPSSTTLLVMCVIPTALMQVNSRVQSTTRKKIVALSMIGFLIFMVVGRLLSGVHWVTDIVGGALLSTGLVMMYRYFVTLR